VHSIKVGSWAEYLVFDVRKKSSLRLRMAIVERTEAGTWTELTLAAPGLDRLIVKCLVKGDSRNPEAVRRVILKAGNLQPVEIVGANVAEAAPRYEAPLGSPKSLGIETVRVPAGAIRAEHVRISGKGETQDAWISKAIPLFGLVKFRSRDLILELTDSGTNAKSHITGRVGKLDIGAFRGTGPSTQRSK